MLRSRMVWIWSVYSVAFRRQIQIRRRHSIKNFEICDDAASGYMQGICAGIDERQHAITRDAELASLSKTWSGRERAALKHLLNALDNFAIRRADDETDLSGSARRALQIGADSDKRDRFVADLRNMESGTHRSLIAADIDARNRQLNRVYGDIMRARRWSALGMGTIGKSGIFRTQRAWLAYRSAWGKFAVIKYPKISPKATAAQLTARRARQLAQLVGSD